MPLFISLTNNQRKAFFKELKKEINNSWETFYEKYNISRSMFFNYLSGRYDIPQDLFEKWKDIAGIRLKSPILIEKQKFLKKDLPPIKFDEKLAEIFGILNGDGHISQITYEICVVGSSKEEEYLNYIKTLFESKFKFKFVSIINETHFKLRTYSVSLFNLLTKEYNLPSGNKMGKLKIPSIVKSSKSFLIAYLKGLFDTDGTIYIRRKKDLVLEISSADKRFLKEVHDALHLLGFNVKLYEKHVTFYNLKDIYNFFKIVKPANTKHLKKYQNYLILDKRR